MFCLIGALFYAISNVGQEKLVKSSSGISHLLGREKSTCSFPFFCFIFCFLCLSDYCLLICIISSGISVYGWSLWHTNQWPSIVWDLSFCFMHAAYFRRLVLEREELQTFTFSLPVGNIPDLLLPAFLILLKLYWCLGLLQLCSCFIAWSQRCWC